jgi:oligopeptide transport system substrate-binding protein
VKVVAPTTLEVTLDGPKPYFLAKLTHPAAFVIRVKDTQAGEDWILTAAASGPYVIQKQVNGAAIILERNENSPLKPGIRYLVFISPQGIAPLSLYESGDIDILPVQLDDWPQLSKASNPLHADFHTGQSMCTQMLQINPNSAPMDDLNVRKAFALATDTQALLLKLNQNIDILATSILPPSMPGYLAGRAVPGFDPEAAKAALAASRYAGNMPPIVLVASGYGDTQRTDVATLVGMWQKNLGVTVRVQYVDPTDYMKNARTASGQMTLLSWCADYPDPENFLNELYHSSSAGNVGQVANSDLDALLEKAGIEQDTGKRLELYQQAEGVILDQVYAIPMSHTILGVLVKPRVKGFVLSPLYNVVLPDLSLQPEWSK